MRRPALCHPLRRQERVGHGARLKCAGGVHVSEYNWHKMPLVRLFGWAYNFECILLTVNLQVLCRASETMTGGKCEKIAVAPLAITLTRLLADKYAKAIGGDSTSRNGSPASGPDRNGGANCHHRANCANCHHRANCAFARFHVECASLFALHKVTCHSRPEWSLLPSGFHRYLFRWADLADKQPDDH